MNPVDANNQKILRVPELVNLLRSTIEQKQIPGDTPMDSTRKLASKYGVSPVTANRAINELVKQKVLYRVPAKGTFVSKSRSWHHPGARIGYYPYQGFNVHSKEYHLGIGHFYQMMSNFLKQSGYDISMITNIEKDDLSILRRTLDSTDALLLNKEFINRETLPLLCAYPRLIILMDSPMVSDNPFHQVVPDPFKGFWKAADYFAETGVKEVVITGVQDTETHQFRRKLFRHVMKTFHPEIILHDDLTYECQEYDYGEKCGRAIGGKYLKLSSRPAIFSVSDYVSFGILEVLENAGLQAGRDFKLISYDNLEALGVSPYKEPRLTTIEHPHEQLCRELINLLSDLLTNPVSNYRIVRVPAQKLIKRATA